MSSDNDLAFLSAAEQGRLIKARKISPVDLDIPEAVLNSVMLRLSGWFAEMEDIERELSAAMDQTEPVPPVYPHEEQ